MMAFNNKQILGIKPTACVFAMLSLMSCGSGSGGDITLTGNDNQSSDPVVVEVPIAYIKRAVPDTDDTDFVSELRDPLAFNSGAELFVRARASNTAEEINVTEQMLAIAATEESVETTELAIDIKDLNTAFDGSTLIYAARIVVEPVDDNLEDSTWNLWEYNFETGTASYLVNSATTRNEGAADGSSQDIAPHYLPDGRIVFSSTRQVNSLTRLAAEGRPLYIYAGDDVNGSGPSSVLHIFDPDDNSFQQISFNPSHDLSPTVIETGEIVFSRWDNGPGNNRLSLYKINPSGRQLSRLYGYHSNDSGTDPAIDVEFSQPREMEDGRLMAILRTNVSNTLGGNIVIIDTENYVDHDQPIWVNQGSSGEGQAPLTPGNIIIDDPLSPGGQYSAAFPLHDGTGRVLLSWSQCRALDDDLTVPCSTAPEDAPAAPAFYGLWIYDPQADTQLPIINPEEGFIYTEIVAAESRSFPAVPNDEGLDVFDSQLVDSASPNEGFGLLKIDSIYDFDGIDNSDLDGLNDTDVGIAARANPASPEYANRPARFIRIVKPLLFPDPDNDNIEIPDAAFGRGNNRLQEILGYAPIEPDGSVSITVPANTPFALSILDANGRRISNVHNVWMQLGPGEIQHCAGCHANNSDLPHGRLDSRPPSSNTGAQSIAVGSGTGIGFPNTTVDRTDYPVNFLDGADIGDTMADIFDLQRPVSDKTEASHKIDLELTYQDEWADTVNGQTADPSLDYSYDTGWSAYPTSTNSLAPYVNRLVINYTEHIQAIWERTERVMENSGAQVNDPNDVPADSCVSCHRSNAADNATEDIVPAGQLDLTAHIEDDFYRSYNELLSNDTERWLDENNAVTDRLRTCTIQQDDGMGGVEEVPAADPNPPTVQASMRTSGANNSNAFFNCFDTGNNCGAFVQQAEAPINCVENGTIVVDPLPYNHAGWLTDGELRVISEWLDTGGHYYNDPFHSDIFPP
ncbi:MAG: hypothetical protein JKY66_02035 [Spongiibacteraceae bacterium]|nr:hypothetical protein [Spongiibacteraceae bacterium]